MLQGQSFPDVPTSKWVQIDKENCRLLWSSRTTKDRIVTGNMARKTSKPIFNRNEFPGQKGFPFNVLDEPNVNFLQGVQAGPRTRGNGLVIWKIHLWKFEFQAVRKILGENLKSFHCGNPN